MEQNLETLKKYLGDDTLTEEQLREKYDELKEEHNREVGKLRKEYEDLDMDVFIERIGGWEKIEQMKKINEKADNIQTKDGKVVSKSAPRTNDKENLDEWKKGFMEGYDEAYKGLMANR